MSPTCSSQTVQVCNHIHSWGLVALVAEGGEGVVDGGGSCWALGVVGRSLNVLVPRVLIVGYAGGVGGKGCCVRGGASWFLGLRLGRGQWGEAMHVG